MEGLVDQPAGRPARAATDACAHPDPFMNTIVLEESFEVWRHQVTTRERVRHTVRPLTPEELTAVSLATARESRTHRRWPKEVVEKFLAAEIILSLPSCAPSGKSASIIKWPLYYLARGW